METKFERPFSKELPPLLNCARDKITNNPANRYLVSGDVQGPPNAETLPGFPQEFMDAIRVCVTFFPRNGFEPGTRTPRMIREGQYTLKHMLNCMQVMLGLLSEVRHFTTPTKVPEDKKRKKPDNPAPAPAAGAAAPAAVEAEAGEEEEVPDEEEASANRLKTLAEKCVGKLDKEEFIIVDEVAEGAAMEKLGPFPRSVVHHVPTPPGAQVEGFYVIIYLLDARIDMECGVRNLIAYNIKAKDSLTSLNGGKMDTRATHLDGSQRALNEWPEYIVRSLRDADRWKLMANEGRDPSKPLWFRLGSEAAHERLDPIYQSHDAVQLHWLTLYPRVWMNTIMPDLWTPDDKVRATTRGWIEYDNQGCITDSSYSKLMDAMMVARAVGLPAVSDAGVLDGHAWVGDEVEIEAASLNFNLTHSDMRRIMQKVSLAMTSTAPNQPDTFRKAFAFSEAIDSDLRSERMAKPHSQGLGYFCAFPPMNEIVCGGGGPSGSNRVTFDRIDRDLTPLSSAIAGLFFDLEFRRFLAFTHFETFLLLIGTVVAAKPEYGEQMAFLVNGPPGAGKSHMEKTLRAWLVPATPKNGGSFSQTALSTVKDPGRVQFFHEASASLGIVNEGSKTGGGFTSATEGAADTKQWMSEGFVSRQFTFIDETTKQRSQMSTTADLRGVVIISFNGNPHRVHGPIRDRVVLLNVMPVDREGHTQTKQTALEEERARRNIMSKKQKAHHPFRYFHYFATAMGPIIAGGLGIMVKEERNAMFTIMWSRFEKILKEVFKIELPSTGNRQRNRVMQFASVMALMRLWTTVCLGGYELVQVDENGDVEVQSEDAWQHLREIPLPTDKRIKGEHYLTNLAHKFYIAEEDVAQALSLMADELVPPQSRFIPAQLLQTCSWAPPPDPLAPPQRRHDMEMARNAMNYPNKVHNQQFLNDLDLDHVDVTEMAKTEKTPYPSEREAEETKCLASCVCTKDAMDTYGLTVEKVVAYLNVLKTTKIKYTPVGLNVQTEGFVLITQTVNVPVGNFNAEGAAGAAGVGHAQRSLWKLNVHWMDQQGAMKLSDDPVLSSIKAMLCYHGARSRKIVLAGYNKIDPQVLHGLAPEPDGSVKKVRMPYILETVEVTGELDRCRELVPGHPRLARLTCNIGANMKYNPPEPSADQYMGYEHHLAARTGEEYMRRALGVKMGELAGVKLYRTSAEAEKAIYYRRAEQSTDGPAFGTYPGTYIHQYVAHANRMKVNEEEDVFEDLDAERELAKARAQEMMEEEEEEEEEEESVFDQAR